MRIIDCAQGTPEWTAARCGVPSASNFDKIVNVDGSVSRQRTKYLYQCAGERLSGIVENGFKSAAMIRGTEMEDEARKLYELITGSTVQQIGFCVNENPVYGASPDGFVGDDGLLEIKCPMMSTHVGYLLSNELPSDYVQQTQGQLLVTGRKWVDFMSYYPGIKPLVVRVERDKKFLTKLQVELELFCSELNDICERLK